MTWDMAFSCQDGTKEKTDPLFLQLGHKSNRDFWIFYRGQTYLKTKEKPKPNPNLELSFDTK